ncbi:dihydroneopterin aldolase [Ramlibacter sp. MMS24-I3-19]|uniref:dihydroneopterin aldolase n=1 Tax=Ramlibacter sp. MMS24-I3-19 TaxID=3416606 RepID=UPI003D0056FA
MFLRGLEVQAQIGLHPFELERPQRVVLDIDLYVPLDASTPKHDAIGEVVDYDFVRTVVHERVARGPITLQETLCDDIAAALLAHEGVAAVRVSTRKPDVYPDCEAVGVEVLRLGREPG